MLGDESSGHPGKNTLLCRGPGVRAHTVNPQIGAHGELLAPLVLDSAVCALLSLTPNDTHPVFFFRTAIRIGNIKERLFHNHIAVGY